MNLDKLHKFSENVDDIELSENFTFPFYYEPHRIALKAVAQLQTYLGTQSDFDHNFGFVKGDNDGLGKMFGVLVVKNENNQLGFLAGFSGKLGDQNLHRYFVPPIFDMLAEGSYFLKESERLDMLNKQTLKLEANPELETTKKEWEAQKKIVLSKIENQKKELKKQQKARQQSRLIAEKGWNKKEFAKLKERHNQESINDAFLLREYTIYLKENLSMYEDQYKELKTEIETLKSKMRSMSYDLQEWLFQQYEFLNISKSKSNVKEIFRNRIPNVPPSGAGDCAAPKMFQYAFEHDLKPVAMAEFWWGRSPNSNSRKHGYFYPSCRGKCEPILGFMLEGIKMDPNPLLVNPAIGKTLQTIYEDEHLIVINKPAEFMSVPGKFVTDSVQERLKAQYPDSTGPIIVHRLDMSTSGIMIVTKSKEVHKTLQEQFKSRKVKKRYVALLDGEVAENEGYIDLPLRVDLDNRPYQIVCHDHGKSARTKFEVISRENGQTKIHFYPITGRTHQLRVHASHHLGLNAPIVGDDLYGKRGDRLCLHAEAVWFVHPVTKQDVFFEVAAEF